MTQIQKITQLPKITQIQKMTQIRDGGSKSDKF